MLQSGPRNWDACLNSCGHDAVGIARGISSNRAVCTPRAGRSNAALLEVGGGFDDGWLVCDPNRGIFLKSVGRIGQCDENTSFSCIRNVTTHAHAYAPAKTSAVLRSIRLKLVHHHIR